MADTPTDRESVERLLRSLECAGHSPRIGVIPVLRTLLTRAEQAEAENNDLFNMLDDYAARKRSWRDRAQKAEAERDALRECLQWLSDTIDRSITQNDMQENRLLLGGEYHTGPVVDWAHEILTGLRDISNKILATLDQTKEGEEEDNRRAEMEKARHQEEMRQMEEREMEEHFRRHPHG